VSAALSRVIGPQYVSFSVAFVNPSREGGECVKNPIRLFGVAAALAAA